VVDGDDRDASRRTVSRELAATRNQINETIAAVKSAIDDGRTNIRPAFNGNGSRAAITTANKTPGRDAIRNARNDIKNARNDIKEAVNSIKRALSGGTHSADDGGGTDNATP
jgi:hypothetical protein